MTQKTHGKTVGFKKIKKKIINSLFSVTRFATIGNALCSMPAQNEIAISEIS